MTLFFEFMRALFLAGLRTCVLSPGRECHPVGLFRSIFFRKGSSPLAETRLEQCQDCSIYEPRLKTCGNAWNPEKQGETTLGCFCFMPFKATDPDATCWINERTGHNLGWTD